MFAFSNGLSVCIRLKVTNININVFIITSRVFTRSNIL